MKALDKIYPRCRSILDPGIWERVIYSFPARARPEEFPSVLTDTVASGIPAFLLELAQLELDVYKAKSGHIEIPADVDQVIVNPTLQLRHYSWKNLLSVLREEEGPAPIMDDSGGEFIMIWRDLVGAATKVVVASQQDLLALKMIVEGIGPEEIAKKGKLPLFAVNAAVDLAAERGILLAPKSLIRRDPKSFSLGVGIPECFLIAPVFTLQWHVTQACDLHCKHCYDRSKRSPLTLDQGLGILDDLLRFCLSRNVRGQVTFTGGNPLLYPHVFELYSAASKRGFYLAVLGNPAPREQIENLISIQELIYFQVSLEGLPEYNDMIRGSGHFDRTFEFLEVLRDLGVSSKVMLTLTKDNMDQVLPLAEMLLELTDEFDFNRLSMVGEGADLELPSPREFAEFLKAYREAAGKNPIMSLKDNLFNIVHYREGSPLFGGCTGYGCGAAFNFLTVLPDGEVHACRKFPSLIGNIFRQSMSDIYDSEIARRYRAGSHSCRSCAIRPVCGGCLAVTYSCGLDIFGDRDPYCLMDVPAPAQ